MQIADADVEAWEIYFDSPTTMICCFVLVREKREEGCGGFAKKKQERQGKG